MSYFASLYFRLDGLGNTHSYSYLRDATWPNLRARTLKKVDKAKRTGSSPQEFDEVDNLVLQILGESSPVVAGLKVAEVITVPSSNVPHKDVLEQCFETSSETAETPMENTPFTTLTKRDNHADRHKKGTKTRLLKFTNFVSKN